MAFLNDLVKLTTSQSDIFSNKIKINMNNYKEKKKCNNCL